jgi:hypothetical protein
MMAHAQKTDFVFCVSNVMAHAQKPEFVLVALIREAHVQEPNFVLLRLKYDGTCAITGFRLSGLEI